MSYSLIERLQTKANPGKTNTAMRDIMGNLATGDSSPEVSAITTDQACQALGVSRSGYYAHQAARKQRLGAPAVCAASVHLKAAFTASHKAYGSRRLTTAMAERPAHGSAPGTHLDAAQRLAVCLATQVCPHHR